jgi:dihydropteroate synthase
MQQSFLQIKQFINCNGELLDLSMPVVMGILNITSDSFYTPSCCKNDTEILRRVETIINEGGKIVDVGGASSRPGAEHVSVESEIERLMPALHLIRKHFPSIPISVDTYNAPVALKTITEGAADIINDISGGQMDDTMFDTVAELNVPYVLTHLKGNPQTMQNNPSYENIMREVLLWFAERVELLRQKGVKDIIIDPGFGFGKSVEHNFTLMNNLQQFKIFELPILIGISRKSMIYKLLDITAEQSLNGTTILNTIALTKGANIIRVHDVKQAVECIELTNKLANA